METTNEIIDFSGHSVWDYCPGAWYEKYVNHLRRKPTQAQSDDALTLGSLVHEGLRVWQETHTVDIPSGVVEETNPTSDCYNLALELVTGYAQRYPEESWPLIKCERPLTFPTRYATVTGLAKIDAYFRVDEPTEIESGQEGLRFTLSPGWWVHEYKTKSPHTSLAMFMQRWETDLQASYQMLALRELVGETPQGILVNVLEKPKKYIPKRKCKICDESYEFAMWLPTGTGQYSCPVCGTRATLQPLKENPKVVPTAYYRIPATRTTEKLSEDLGMISSVGKQMEEMRVGGLYSFPHRKGNCVDQKWNRACEYRVPHLENTPTVGSSDYIPTRDYWGLNVAE